MEKNPNSSNRRRGRKPLGEEYKGVIPMQVNLPRVLLEAVDLRAQYDRCSRPDVVREMLWKALRITALTDTQYYKLLKNNGIDISPVNLKPSRDIYTDDTDPSQLV